MPQDTPRRARAAAAALLGALLLAACRGGEAPPAIAYGAQTCAECAQVIAERRFAAHFRTAGGETRAFDDPGCLLAALRKQDGNAQAVFFQDFAADGWIAADDVYLVRVPGVDTPRHHGWVAHADFSAAQDAVTNAGGGEVLRFSEAREKLP